MNQPTGIHPVDATVSRGTVSRIVADVLGDIDSFIITTLEGIYIDLGGGSLGTQPSSQAYGAGNISAGSQAPGTHPQAV